MLPVKSDNFNDFFIDSTAISAAGGINLRGKTDGNILSSSPEFVCDLDNDIDY